MVYALDADNGPQNEGNVRKRAASVYSPPQMSEAVTFEKVSKRFDSVVAVDDVDLSIQDGEFFAMLGPSGSGKTTCLRMIAGFELPSSGRILLHRQDVSRLPPYERDVNTVFQDYALFPHMSVVENVGYSLRVRKVGAAERLEGPRRRFPSFAWRDWAVAALPSSPVASGSEWHWRGR